MSIVCCLIHEMRDSTRVWYSSHLESTSCGARASLLVGKSPWGQGRAQRELKLWGGSCARASLL